MKLRPIPVGMLVAACSIAPVTVSANVGSVSTVEVPRPVVVEHERLSGSVLSADHPSPVDPAYPLVAKGGSSRGGRSSKSDQTGAAGYRQPGQPNAGQAGLGGAMRRDGQVTNESIPNKPLVNPMTPPGPSTTAPNAN